jgi:hypothetical protein
MSRAIWGNTFLGDARVKHAICLAALAPSVLAGCNTEEELQKQRADSIQRETTMLQDLQAYLANQAKAPDSGAISIFVSAGLVDSLLRGLEGITVAIPEADGATLRLNHVKTDFRTGFPGLTLDAIVSRSGMDVAVSLAARIDAFVNNETPDKLGLRVHIDSLVPVVSWSFINFRVSGLVRDLVQVKVSEALNRPGALGNISVPLNSSFTLNLPAGTTTQPVQGAVLAVSSPALSFKVRARVRNIIYLRDGIHLVGQVEAL